MTVIDVADRCGTDLSSRGVASMLRSDVAERADQGLAVLDMSGVRTLSHSFADELFAVLIAKRGEQWFRERVRVEGLNDSARDSILSAVQGRIG